MGYFNEDNKTWWQYEGSNTIIRAHDENFSGMRFNHSRCPFCNRITSQHTLHWLNHMQKHKKETFGMFADEILKLRYKK